MSTSPRRLLPVPAAADAERAAELLREWIISGRLRRGQGMAAADLAGTLGTSRADAGKALSCLIAQGFAVRSRRSVLVAPFQLEAQELLAGRLRREPVLAGLAARRMTEFGLYRLQRLHEDMQEAWRRRDVVAFQRGNYRFHAGLYRLAERPDDVRAVQSLWSVFPFDMLTTLPGRMAAVIGEHEAILQALQDGDARRVSRRMREHVQQGGRAFLLHYPRCPTMVHERKRAAATIRS